MGFPTDKEIQNQLKKLDKVTGTKLLGENPTPLEVLRWDICQSFVKYKARHKITQKELAKRVGVDEAKISKILRHRIDDFTTDRLIKLFCEIESNVKIKLTDNAA